MFDFDCTHYAAVITYKTKLKVSSTAKDPIGHDPKLQNQKPMLVLTTTNFPHAGSESPKFIGLELELAFQKFQTDPDRLEELQDKKNRRKVGFLKSHLS